jgi:8-oxo-dGTP pyrophosphatase MutT (NUDIX family)/GNAT superfamily N-acetyltransferase
MNLPAGFVLSVEERPDAKDRKAIEDALIEFNAPYFQGWQAGRLAVLVRDEGRQIAAGLDGALYAGWLFVNNLWACAGLRGRGVGRELLARAERYAFERGCHSAWLDAFSFQAPEFYRRLGYEDFGTLEYPPEHHRHFLKKRLSPSAGPPNSGRHFPVSVKGVLFEGDRVVLLQNERDEWELPGGRLEPGEDPTACLVREFAEELGTEIIVDAILDCWVYPVLPQREVVIVTYGVRRSDARPLRASFEHRGFGTFAIGELDDLPMPEGYRRSIRSWAARRRV